LTANDSAEVESWRGSLRGHYLLTFYWVFPIVGGSLFVALDATNGIVFWTGIGLLLEGISSVAILSPLYIQRMSCSPTELRFPKSFFRHGTIPIRDISGVGLVWSWTKLDRSHVYGKGWALTIWRHDLERPLRFPQFLDQSKVVGYQYPKRKIPTTMLLNLPSERDQWVRLSESKVALVAKRIYETASAQQGQHGYLLLEAAQLAQSMETPLRGPLYIHAIWSPDGRLRRADVDRARAGLQSENGNNDSLT
jgi:hypothetical protein